MRKNIEFAVITGIMVDVENSGWVLETLNPDHFAGSKYKALFAAIQGVYKAGEPLSMMTMPDSVQEAYLRIPENASALNLRGHVKMLLDVEARDRAVLEIKKALEEDLKPKELVIRLREIENILVTRVTDKGLQHISEHGPAVIKTLMDVKGGFFPGVMTGFSDIDRHDMLLKNGCMSLLMARPKVGKTSLAWNIAVKCKKNVLFFSHEMSAMQLYFRQMSACTGIPFNSFYDKTTIESNEHNITAQANEINKLPIWIDDTRVRTVDEIRMQCERFKLQKHMDLIIIDYLQLVKFNQPLPIRERVTAVSRELLSIAKDFNVPVLAISSVRRPQQEGGPPLMHDLKETGDLEFDADVIMALDRPTFMQKDKPQNQAELYVLANRNGRVGKIYLGYDAATTSFTNYKKDGWYE